METYVQSSDSEDDVVFVPFEPRPNMYSTDNGNPASPQPGTSNDWRGSGDGAVGVHGEPAGEPSLNGREQKRRGSASLKTKLKLKIKRYQKATVASKNKEVSEKKSIKTAANKLKLPFVFAKSAQPSHNVSANVQQILNGVKTQNPVKLVPLTLAHKMGLGHESLKQQTKEFNILKLGERVVRLQAGKAYSFSKLLKMFGNEDGVVSKFLKSLTRKEKQEIINSLIFKEH
ncbi:uncharacterized protein LOC112048230 isoform X2 [Bicyclus anynana]|uniref:Uncharacterized protein LOC112048230 isoform X2 n=1 Tax=Bicyclus anynana TaxID=110368 RepID=A0A6J1N3N5_BICAN|nr:uncharacterized protein LOC112048230 isoform X2 [Bicyclus anynana]